MMEEASKAGRATFIGAPDDFVAARHKELMATDAQFRAALSLPPVNEAKLRRELGLAQVVATCMEAYADRPALGQRASELATDPATSRTTRQLLKHFETVSYRELGTSRTFRLHSFASTSMTCACCSSFDGAQHARCTSRRPNRINTEGLV